MSKLAGANIVILNRYNTRSLSLSHPSSPLYFQTIVNLLRAKQLLTESTVFNKFEKNLLSFRQTVNSGGRSYKTPKNIPLNAI